MKRLVCWLRGHRWKSRAFEEVVAELIEGNDGVSFVYCCRRGYESSAWRGR